MGYIGRWLDLEKMHIDDLQDLALSIERDMEEFFDDDEDGIPYYGDQGYQDLCEDLNEVEEVIEKKLKEQENGTE
jgi:hypothetical protein